MGGKTDEVKGRIKEAAGVLTGNDKLRAEGKTECEAEEHHAAYHEDQHQPGQSSHFPPVPVDDPAASFERLPRTVSSIDDQHVGERVCHKQIDPRQDEQ